MTKPKVHKFKKMRCPTCYGSALRPPCRQCNGFGMVIIKPNKPIPTALVFGREAYNFANEAPIQIVRLS